METTIFYRVILGLYRDNGKENGNYNILWGSYWDFVIGVLL